MKSELTDVKMYYRAHIEYDDKNNLVVIYGFNVNEVLGMEQYLRDCIEFKHSVELPIKVAWYQSLFLQTKYRNTLKALNCDAVFPSDSDFQSGFADMLLIGRKFNVDKGQKLIGKVIDELQVSSLKFKHGGYGEMWIRKWHKVKKKMEEEEEIAVNVIANLDEKITNNPADKGLTVELKVIGSDEAISKAEDAINSIGTTLLRKTEDFDKIQLVLVLRGLKSKKLLLREDYNTEVLLDWDKLTIELITPNGSPEDLEAAYSTVMAYIEGVAINKEMVALENPSLGIFLQQHSKQWQQILTIGKRHSVLVELFTDFIDVCGETNDVVIAKKLIGDKVQEILELFEERKIVVNDLFLPILDTPMFEAITTKVSHDYDSILWCKVMHNIQIKKPDGSMLTIGVYSGNILDETSDAIVNILDCNTQVVVNLPDELISAGGPTLQQEYDEYVKLHEPIGVCQAVCLGSGDLNCKKLIHVVPLLGSNREILGLNKTMTNVLLLAEEHSITSILIPSIYNDLSALSECAKITMSLCAKGSLGCLKLVRFVLPTVEIAYHFKQKLMEFDHSMISGMANHQYFNWFWEDDFGCFKAYSPESSAFLSKKFYLKVPTSTLTIGGNSYTIDLTKMQQINDQTLRTRQIKKEQSQPVWKYKNDQGHWDPYTEQQSQEIEAMWQAKKPHVLKIGKWKYSFKFDTTPMTQMNVLSRHKHPICRESTHYTHTSCEQMSLLLIGPKQNLDKAENDIDELFKSNIATKEISITSSLPANLICDISTKYGIEYNITATQVILKGFKSNVLKAKEDITDELLKISSKDVSLPLPVEWEPQVTDLELKPLSGGTSEWSKVSKLFHATMTRAKVVKIERIQNKWLWEKYSQHSQRMSRKNGNKSNEKLLFHGTRDTLPSSIYQDEEGFDMRYSNPGMWGIGIYFAVKASYSDRYAHLLPDGTKQLLLAKVLTGDSIELPSRRDLRMPPIKGKSPKGVAVRYDTVRGNTKDSVVYIAYSNDKAYPFYLITYKDNF